MEPPSSRCAFSLDQTEHSGVLEEQKACCWLETWNDTDHCVWHARVNDKTFSDLEAAEYGELLRGAYLSGIDFEYGFDFSNCDLTGAVFEAVDFADSCFDGADLTYSDANDVQWRGEQASLEDVDFSHTNLYEVQFEAAGLENATFDDADCRLTHFDAADLRNADFGGDNTNFTRVSLSKAVLRDAEFGPGRLDDVTFDGATLSQATFSGTTLKDVSYEGAETKLIDAAFEGVTLEDGSSFQGAVLSGCRFAETTAKSPVFFERIRRDKPQRFVASEFQNARFHDADLQLAEFEDVDLRGAEFGCANLNNAEFRECNLRGGDFSCADGTTLMETGLFSSTDLRTVDFRDTALYQTIFSDNRIDGQTRFDTETPYERRDETETGDDKKINDYAAAAWVHRRVKALHESNAMTWEARTFHINANEANRKYLKQQLFGNADRSKKIYEVLSLYIGSSLNRYLTNHGESLGRIVSWAILTIVGFSVLYPLVGGINDGGVPYQITIHSSLNSAVATYIRSFYFSAITFTTIGYGNVYPVGLGSRILIIIESSLGAVLTALFVFVLGRQVNR